MPVIYHKNTMYGGGSGGSGGASAISDLTDVELTDLADGQILKYDATNQVWVNDDESGGGGGSKITDLLYSSTNVKVGTYQLESSYENYDLITIVGGTTNDESLGNKEVRTYSVDALKAFFQANANNKVLFTGYSNRYFTFRLSGSSIIISATDGSQGLYMIYGTKLGSGGGGANVEEMSKDDYDLITPEQDKVYFVYDEGEETKLLHSKTGTSYQYSNVPDNADELIVLVSLNNIVYAGFYFDISTKNSTEISSADLIALAQKLNMNYNTNSTVTVTQSQTNPYIYWVNGSNHDYLYLDVSNYPSAGTRCGYSGCTSHLFYKGMYAENKIYLNERIYGSYKT